MKKDDERQQLLAKQARESPWCVRVRAQMDFFMLSFPDQPFWR
jgi:hypothetical protein